MADNTGIESAEATVNPMRARDPESGSPAARAGRRRGCIIRIGNYAFSVPAQFSGSRATDRPARVYLGSGVV
jgi:hypothetical protein